RSPCLSERALRYNLTNEGGVDGTWRVLKNVMGLWLVQRCRAALEAGGGPVDYPVLMEQAAQATPCRSLVNPDDGRFLNPADMPAALRDFCRETGQPGPLSPGEGVRCALDSLALRYARVLEQLEEVGGGPIETVHLVGGGSRNVLLNQLTADATGRVVVAGPAEATVTGNLLVQLAALGELGGLSDLRAVTAAGGERRVFEPRPDTRALWDEARARSAGWPG
ncbi:MAG: FGGY-family carbohydrate kinase, partial [Verrucomicrobiota bacterium]